MFCAINQLGHEWEPAEQSVSENNTGKNLAHDLRLPQLYENPAKDLSDANQQKEEDKDLSQFGICHLFSLGRLDAALLKFVCSANSPAALPSATHRGFPVAQNL
jgi:hypothetical protein